jgi:hypothetical protein
MSRDPAELHPHDVGLPAGAVRKRQNNRYLAYWMIATAIVTAVPGWFLYGLSVRNAHRMAEDAPLLVIAAYVLLIISSATLVLGLWYLLLAQVRRIAHITGEEEIDTGPEKRLLCKNCGWFFDPPDRYCRHCGKLLREEPTSHGAAAI